MSAACTGAFAAESAPSTGLGQAWPNAPDVSASPHWHVYAFQRAGIRYIQVNDLNGNVRAAFATSGEDFLSLPIGLDASRLATPQDPLPPPASGAGEIVYHDGAVQVLVAPQTDGTVQLRAAPGTCNDPIECSSHLN
ncbi:hypothetical protein [Frateuria sp. Soil773]|uniref:hypothetical protein n=1 Tax=Frateuria sp. Soil773 TaxID=1736407 RepID=UPI0012FB0480|nr:hypothetical protein [Frateuria sp. Soil773]